MGYLGDIAQSLTAKLNPIITKVNELTHASRVQPISETGSGSKAKWHQVLEVELHAQYANVNYVFEVIGRNMTTYELTLELERGASGFSIERLNLYRRDSSVGYNLEFELVNDQTANVARLYARVPGSDWNSMTMKLVHQFREGSYTENWEFEVVGTIPYPSNRRTFKVGYQSGIRTYYHTGNLPTIDPEATANTIAKRDAAADLKCRLLRSTHHTATGVTSGAGFVVRNNNTNDNYLRTVTKEAAQNYLRSGFTLENFTQHTYYSGNCNSIQDTGIYFVNGSASNKPANGVLWHGAYIPTSGNHGYDCQFLVGDKSTGAWYRSKNNGSWGAWVKLARETDIPTPIELTSDGEPLGPVNRIDTSRDGTLVFHADGGSVHIENLNVR
jgi:hypothetical protein